MANNASEPILSHDQVQRMIDERLEVILEQEARDSRKGGKADWESGKSLLKRIEKLWKRMIKHTRK